MKDDPYNALHRDLVEVDPTAKLEKQREVDDVKWLMSNKRGRRIVYRILDNAGVFRLSYSSDAMQMAFNEGNRNSGLIMLSNIISHCPARYAEMIEESAQ